MKNRGFNCTQQELYAVCISGWMSCIRNIEKFTSLKSKYTREFADAKLLEVERVSKLPDHHYRSGIHERLRLELSKRCGSCLEAWKYLESYIKEAWQEPLERDKSLKMAGQPYYREAYKQRWETCSGMMVAAEKFIIDHEAILALQGNMPDDFPNVFSTRLADFHVAMNNYRQALEASLKDKDEKALANRKLYRELMAMFRDAKILFRRDPVTLRRFMFETVLHAVSGMNGAGIRGNISAVNTPVMSITGLVLHLMETGETMPAGNDATFRFARLAAGNYTLKVTAPGFVDQTIPVVVNAGSFTIVNILLEKVVQ